MPGLIYFLEAPVVGGGASNSHSVEGMTPETYTAEGNMVSVAFQKTTPKGSLTVTILRDDQMVKTETTSAEYGRVTIATQ